MTKMVPAAQFKVHCAQIMAEAARNGETIVITKRGKPFMELKPIESGKPESLIGFFKGKIKILGDIDEPFDPDWEARWEANNPPELYR